MTDSLEEKFTRADRDRIILLDAKVDNLIDTVKEIKDNTVSRVSRLELEKTNQKDFTELFSRVEKLEDYRSFIIGALSLIGLVSILITYIYFTDINQIKHDLEKHAEETKESLKQ